MIPDQELLVNYASGVWCEWTQYYMRDVDISDIPYESTSFYRPIDGIIGYVPDPRMTGTKSERRQKTFKEIELMSNEQKPLDHQKISEILGSTIINSGGDPLAMWIQRKRELLKESDIYITPDGLPIENSSIEITDKTRLFYADKDWNNNE